MIRKMIVAGFCLTLAGCGGPSGKKLTPDELSAMVTGQKAEKLVELFGKPEDVSVGVYGFTTYYYRGLKGYYVQEPVTEAIVDGLVVFEARNGVVKSARVSSTGKR